MACWKSLCASWLSRSSFFFFSSRSRARLCCSSGLRRSGLSLQLLGQRVDLVAFRLELLAARIEPLLEVGKIALTFIGLGHGHLEGDDADPGGFDGFDWSGGSLGMGIQDEA